MLKFVTQKFANVTSHELPIPAFISLMIIFIITGTLSPQFLTVENFQALADQAAITLILACGLTFVILMGSIDLSSQGLIAASAMSVSLLVANDRTKFNFGLSAILIGISIGALIGLVAGLSLIYIRIPSFIATIATWNIGLGIAYILFGGASQPGVEDEKFLALSFDTFMGLSKVVWIAVGVFILFFLIQKFTVFGRYTFVIGGSEEVALLSGINVKFYRTLAFVLSGACSGLAGALLVSKMGIGAVNAGQDLLFLTISSVVIGGTLLSGGRGGILHSLIGVLIMTSIYISMILLDVDSLYQGILEGFVVLFVVTISYWKQRQPLKTVV